MTIDGRLKPPPVGGCYRIELHGSVVRVLSLADASRTATPVVVDSVQRDCGDRRQAQAELTRLVKELGR